MFPGRLLVEEFFEHFFVKGRAGNFVFLGGPIAQIEQAAALAAKREVGVALGVGRFLADGTVVFHQRNQLTAASPSG
jgi:hypothetical protein